MAKLVTITISNFTYIPQDVSVSVGDSLQWKNNDIMAHTATSISSLTFDTGLIAPHQTSKPIAFLKPTGAEGFDYGCTPHPFMSGKIIVVP